MANNPPKSSPQAHAPEAVVLDISASANEAVQTPPKQNGQAGGPQVSYDQLLHSIQELQARAQHTFDLRDKATLEFIATAAEANGAPELACHLRSQAFDKGILAGMKRVTKRNITVGHVLITAGIITGVLLVWEGIAYKFDLPRFGLFDPSNPMKVLSKKA